MTVVKAERVTQNTVITHLRDRNGYKYLGYLDEQENEPYIEDILKRFLVEKQGCTDKQAEEATKKLRDFVAQCHDKHTLLSANYEIYNLLRYPTSVSQGLGQVTKQIRLIDWQNPLNNFFHIAEEVTVKRASGDGTHRRPDVVIYVNGIALVVIELKKASVSALDAIHQLIRNQEDGQIPAFFTTAQLLLAGSESEGLSYGTILTTDKFYLRWKEPTGAHYPKPTKEPAPFTTPFPASEFKNELYRSLLQMLEPKRLLDFIYNCIIFDGGIKKVARPNQYFALQACRQRCIDKENGIIWHSQGSGKSLTMIWLAQWILENITNSRVVIITDRDELDSQITAGFKKAKFHPCRATSGKHLIDMLNGTNQVKGESAQPDLITTLVHKFGIASNNEANAEKEIKGKRSAEEYLREVAENLPAGYSAKGNLYVFVDECHRTQGGVLNKAMCKIMGENVMLIGFTGTPLLKVDKDRLTSRESFGSWISTYKFNEAVDDKIVLDLRYEARSVEQQLSNDADFDELFEFQTATLTPSAKMRLQKRWGDMQHLFSSRNRIDVIVRQICKDFTMKTALREGWGNAMLVADSVYQAFRYWEKFETLPYFKGKTAVITSYNGAEPGLDEGFSGMQKTEAEFKHEQYTRMVNGKTAEEFETFAKNKFINEPSEMKLLIVFDKLLTGFDAPSATYIYIDSVLHNHTLFQAICRVNRTNGAKKQYGYIVDYKDLFNEISEAIEDYTNGEFGEFDKEDVQNLLKNRIKEARKDLDKAIQLVKRLSEPVALPKSLDDYFDYFCYNQATVIEVEQQQEMILRNQHKREDFYDAAANLVRAYVAIALEMDAAGYTKEEAVEIYNFTKDIDQLRNAIMRRCGDYVDLGKYDAEMRALLDDYVVSPQSQVLASLDDFSFLDVIEIKEGEDDDIVILSDPPIEEVLGGQRGVAETITQNVRRVINRKRDTNPEEYKKFSEKINRLLEEFQQKQIEYKEFLKSIVELANQLKKDTRPDERLNTSLKKSLYDNLGKNVEFALAIYNVIESKAEIGFRENMMRRKKLKREIENALAGTDYDAEEILQIVIAHTDFQR